MLNDPTLANLRDIHLPPTTTLWPLATGYYLLGFVTILLALIIIFCIHHYRRNAFKREAIDRLNEVIARFELNQNHRIATAEISILLKRVALVYYPREHVAGLYPDAWVTFLEKNAKCLDFSGVRDTLIKGPYQPDYLNDATPLLFSLAKQWIKQQRGPHV